VGGRARRPGARRQRRRGRLALARLRAAAAAADCGPGVAAVNDFDVCVIGSGAGGGPVAFAVAEAGYRVVVLEKGPWLREGDFSKDEVGEVRRNKYTPREHDEPRVMDAVAA